MDKQPDIDDPPQTAAEWLLALLERSDDPRLREDLAVWLAASPDHAREWEEINRTYRIIGGTVPRHPEYWAPPARSRHAGMPLSRNHSKPSHRRTVGALAAIAVAACVGLAVLPGVIARLAADFATGTAEIRSVELPDGSVVQLAPESKLAVEITDTERQIKLLEGTAYFDVHPDPARPFRVVARGVEATAVGTAFEVRLDDGATAVAVREGVVRAERHDPAPPTSERLEAGEWVRLGERGPAIRGRIPPDRIAAWRDGLLIANDRPVGEVVDDLRPYFGGIVILRGDTLAHQPLTGIYRLSDPDAAIEAIAAAQGARVFRLSPWMLVIQGG